MTDKPKDSQQSPISIVRQIKSGQRKYDNLSMDDKICCIEFLMERLTNSEIAEALGISYKTVSRRKVDIRKKNAIKQSPEFTPQFIGSLYHKIEYIYSSLIKISEVRDNPPFAQVSALTNAAKTLLEYSKFLQSMGYLPRCEPHVDQEFIDGNLVFTSLDDLTNQLAILKDSLEQKDAIDTEITLEIAEIENHLAVINLSNKIKRIESKIVENDKNVGS